MVLTLVHIHVKPEFREAFIEASRKNHENSIQEPGNLRFDVLQEADDPNKFILYEVYETEADVLAHKETAHYHTWRTTVEEMMAVPRQGVRHHVIAPLDKGLW